MCQPEFADSSDESFIEEVKALRVKLYEALQEFKKGALVKLNWRST